MREGGLKWGSKVRGVEEVTQLGWMTDARVTLCPSDTHFGNKAGTRAAWSRSTFDHKACSATGRQPQLGW